MIEFNESVRSVFENYRNKYAFFKSVESDVEQAVMALINTYNQNGKLLVCGNGGSSTDADHIVGELVKGFTLKRPLDQSLINRFAQCNGDVDAEFLLRAQSSLPAINLGAHTGLMTAVSNDIGADLVFVQGVLGYGQPGDTFMGISTSGNSDNVVKAGLVAKTLGITTIGLTGASGGKMAEAFDICIKVPAHSTPDIQDMHTPVYHVICAAVEHQYWEV